MDYKRLVMCLTISIIVLIILIVIGVLNKCFSDSCTLWNGFLLGVFSSILASAIAYLISRLPWRRRFGKIEGEYEGKVFKKDAKGKDTWELEEETVSKAKIEYKRDNILSITLTSLKDRNFETREYLVWAGEMTMESENFGTIVWQYTNLPKPQHRFGFKRCIVRKEPEKVYVYLIGEMVEGYGQEVLIKTG